MGSGHVTSEMSAEAMDRVQNSRSFHHLMTTDSRPALTYRSTSNSLNALGSDPGCRLTQEHQTKFCERLADLRDKARQINYATDHDNPDPDSTPMRTILIFIWLASLTLAIAFNGVYKNDRLGIRPQLLTGECCIQMYD